jgi:hypothetical protein
MPFGWVATTHNPERCSPLCQYLRGTRCERFEVDMMDSRDGPMRNLVCMSSSNEAEELIRLGGNTDPRPRRLPGSKRGAW